jgi:hypothetical protein
MVWGMDAHFLMKKHTYEMYLRIDRTFYRVLPLSIDLPSKSLWRFRKKSGREYTVHEGEFGLECDCPDFIYRRQNRRLPCKHCMALIELRLVEEEIYAGDASTGAQHGPEF